MAGDGAGDAERFVPAPTSSGRDTLPVDTTPVAVTPVDATSVGTARGAWVPGSAPLAGSVVARTSPEPIGGPPRMHRWGLGAFLLAEAVFLVATVVYVLLAGEPETLSVLGVGGAIGLPTVLAAAVAVAATILRGNGPRADLRLIWSWRDVGVGLGFGFGGLFLTAAAGAVYVSIVGPDVSSAVGDIFGGRRADLPVALLIGVLVVLVAPLCEEIIYRGLLWGALEKLGVRRWLVFGLTTVIFAAAHFEARAPLLVFITIPIALARLYTGRLLAGIVAHQVNNLLPGVVLVLGLLGVVQL